MRRQPSEGFRLGAIYAETVRTCFARAHELLELGLLVFVPLALLNAAVDHIEVHTGVDSATLIAGAVVVVALQTGSTLLGEVFYSGAVAGLLTSPQEQGLAPRKVLRTLAFRRLIAADLLFSVGLVVGLLLLIVPGVLFFTWFGLVAPVIEIEKRHVRDGFARSRRLVRGHFWTVLAVLGPVTVASDALINAIVELGHSALGHSFWSSWISEGVANVLVSPFYAVPAVLLTLKLIAINKGDS